MFFIVQFTAKYSHQISSESSKRIIHSNPQLTMARIPITPSKEFQFAPPLESITNKNRSSPRVLHANRGSLNQCHKTYLKKLFFIRPHLTLEMRITPRVGWPKIWAKEKINKDRAISTLEIKNIFFSLENGRGAKKQTNRTQWVN